MVGGRVYGGSGVDRDVDGPQAAPPIFCLDADTGTEIWREKTDLPVWGKPVVAGEQAFFPLGNGDAVKSVEPPAKPAGAILCVSPQDGKAIVAASTCPMASSRGRLPMPGRSTSAAATAIATASTAATVRSRWKHDLGSPVVASPSLAACSCCGLTNSVYAVSRRPRKGIAPKVCCLDAATGRLMWQLRPFPTAVVISSPVVTVEPGRDGDRRAVYFGAGINVSTHGGAVLPQGPVEGE